MCLLVFALQQHPRLPLIVAGNRDEFHARPTQPAHWWADQPDILGGRDLQAGGTWMAISRSGRFAAVTNFRDAQRESAKLRSRGHLIADFLQSDAAPLAYLQSVDGDRYAGFNLVVADSSAAAYLSNRGGGCRELPPGIYGLSNATLDSAWTKVTRSKARLATLIDTDSINDTTLLRLLNDHHRAAADEVESGELPFAMAHALTAPFIVMPDYGTRASTVLTVTSSGRVRLLERRFDPAGRSTGQSAFDFELAAEDGQ